MSLPARLLNRLVTVKRKGTGVASSYSTSGDLKKGANEVDVVTNVPIRINRHVPTDKDRLQEDVGAWINSSHKGFSDPLWDIQIGDYLQDQSSGERFLVAYNDETPGGELDHHYEIYINSQKG